MGFSRSGIKQYQSTQLSTNSPLDKLLVALDHGIESCVSRDKNSAIKHLSVLSDGLYGDGTISDEIKKILGHCFALVEQDRFVDAKDCLAHLKQVVSQVDKGR